MVHGLIFIETMRGPFEIYYTFVYTKVQKSLKLREINLNSDFNLNSYRPAYKFCFEKRLYI